MSSDEMTVDWMPLKKMIVDQMFWDDMIVDKMSNTKWQLRCFKIIWLYMR